MSSTRRGYLFALAALVIWVGFVPVSRMAGLGALSFLDTIALRFGVAAVILLPFLWRRGLAFMFTPRMLALALSGGIGYALCVYAAFQLAPATHGAILLSGVLPFFTALIAFWLLGERPDRARQTGLALIALGIACMAVEQLGGSEVSPLGDSLFLAGSAAWGLYSVLLRRWQVPAWDATMGVAVISAVLYLPVYALFLPSNLAVAPLADIVLQAVYQGVLVVVVAMILFARAVAELGPVRLSMFMAMVPGLAVLVSVPLLGETLRPWPLVGLLFVSLGALQPWNWRKTKTPPAGGVDQPRA